MTEKPEEFTMNLRPAEQVIFSKMSGFEQSEQECPQELAAKQPRPAGVRQLGRG